MSEAAAALRSGDPVYSAPDAENALSGAEVDALATQVLASEVPMFVAVLPAAAAAVAPPTRPSPRSRTRWGWPASTPSSSATSSGPGRRRTRVADLATQAFRTQRDAGAAAVLSEFVTLADQRFSSAPSGDSAGSSSAGGGGSGLMIVLLVMIIGGAVVVVVMSRRAKKTRELQLAAVRRTVDEDITEYGERLGSFSLADPDFDDATRADMQRALDSYDRAKSSVGAHAQPGGRGQRDHRARGRPLRARVRRCPPRPAAAAGAPSALLRRPAARPERRRRRLGPARARRARRADVRRLPHDRGDRRPAAQPRGGDRRRAAGRTTRRARSTARTRRATTRPSPA